MLAQAPAAHRQEGPGRSARAIRHARDRVTVYAATGEAVFDADRQTLTGDEPAQAGETPHGVADHYMD
jgi:hypothetical protein